MGGCNARPSAITTGESFMGRLDQGFVTRARNGGVGKGRYRDGGGLILNVSNGGASWMLRYMLDGRRRDAGLGPLAQVGLAQARRLAAEHLNALKSTRVDPIRQRHEQRAREAKSATFDAVAEAYISEHEVGWRNPKHRQQWRNTIAAYVCPKLGTKPVSLITTEDILGVLRPVWRRIPETADRLRGRIEVILDYARVKGFRDGPNPAIWRGNISLMLPRKTKLKTTRHHAAIEVDRLPAVYQKLAASADTAAQATRFCILTAARPGEAAGMTWAEVDLATATWTVPARRMKTGREHRVALSSEAMTVLKMMAKRRTAGAALVFPGYKQGRPLTLPTLSKALHIANGGNGVTLHGTARSGLDDYISEKTDFSQKLIDRALSHQPKGGKTVRAYRRADLLEPRRPLMQRWADYLRGA